MSIWLKTVTRAWADVAEKLASPNLVVVWQIGRERAWRGMRPDDLVLFRLEGTRRDVVGYGRFIATTHHMPEDAWALFDSAMGAWTPEALLAQIAARRERADTVAVELANALVAEPVFVPPLNPYELPSAFDTNTRVPLCLESSPEGQILFSNLRHHAGRALIFGEAPQDRLLGPRTYRLPGLGRLVDRRTLRSIMIDRYGGRCAISGEPVGVTLDAAHVWPRMFGGPDEIGNMLLLSVEFNRLWDAGLIGVDQYYRVIVSDLLRLSPQRSRYLAYAGQPLRRRKFGPPYPDEANLRWHRNHLFRWPKHKPRE